MKNVPKLVVTAGIAGVFLTLALVLADSNDIAGSLPVLEEQTEMVEAAAFFLDGLDGEQLDKARHPFEGDIRFDFNYVPMDVRTGLMLKDMTLQQRNAAHSLLRTALSNAGYLKVTGIMHLEEILFFLEGDDRIRDRDPEQYYIAIFGNPSIDEPWGWRFEGHHISLNFSSVTNELFSTTPVFLGSNPAEVRSGPYAGLRVLGAEEDLGRDLLASLSSEQLSKAVFRAEAPSEIFTSNDQRVELDTYEGLAASEMTPLQKELLWRLLEEQANNNRPDIADAQLEKISEAGVDSLYFGWAGSLDRVEPHYYRVHGPTVLFEYDNVQNDANHVHSVWRDLQNDFGMDHLQRHYETAGHDHGHDSEPVLQTD